MTREELLDSISAWAGREARKLRHERLMRDDPRYREFNARLIKMGYPWGASESVENGKPVERREWLPFEKGDADR